MTLNKVQSVQIPQKRFSVDEPASSFYRSSTIADRYEVIQSIDISICSFSHVYNELQKRRDFSSVINENENNSKIQCQFFIERYMQSDLEKDSSLLFDSEDPFPNGPIQLSISEEIEELNPELPLQAKRDRVLDICCFLSIIEEELDSCLPSIEITDEE